jgi:hypothetical protein
MINTYIKHTPIMKNKHVLLGVALMATLVFGCKKKEDEKVEENPTPNPTETNFTVSGDVQGTWKKGSTYNVSGSIFIQKGASLTIEEGVTVIFDAAVKPEVIVKGNLYSMGTAASPVKFTVAESMKTADNAFGKLWGGIIGSPDCAEMVFVNTILEYGGATTTEESASVKEGLYKGEAGENVPAIYFGNVNGKFIFQNNTLRNFQEDALYIEGGQLIISNNMFYTTGIANGEAINLKSGVLADVAFNLVFSPNTNAMKLSNSGDRQPQAYIIAYNNTMLNCGWRRPDTKGGSIWLEKGVRVDLVNNLQVNDRYGVKRDTKAKEDDRSTFFKTQYYGATQTGVDQFQPNDAIITGTGDIISATVGANDPKFVNYPLSNAGENSAFDASWDFHLQAGAPGLGQGKTDFTRHFASGLIVNGVTYTSPAPANFIGAFGTK